MTVLVDTSVWIDHLRDRVSAQVAELRALLLRPRAVAVAPPILQEILQGATTPERFAALSRQFGSIRCVQPRNAPSAAIHAARVYLECRMRGTTPRSSNDCLIACIAIDHGLALLHSDRGFEAIGEAEPALRIHPCGRGGRVDE